MASQPKYDINVNQYATFKLALTYGDGHGTFVDMSGWAIHGSIKETAASPDPVVDFDIRMLSAVSGTFEFSLTPEKTALLTKPRYVYDILATNLDPNPDEKYRILEGKVRVHAGVTEQ